MGTNTQDIIWSNQRRQSEHFLFFDKTGRLLEKIMHNYMNIYQLDVTWWLQKNGQHMQKISFWQDDIDSRWCPVRAAWPICMKPRELKQNLDHLLGISKKQRCLPQQCWVKEAHLGSSQGMHWHHQSSIGCLDCTHFASQHAMNWPD